MTDESIEDSDRAQPVTPIQSFWPSPEPVLDEEPSFLPSLVDAAAKAMTPRMRSVNVLEAIRDDAHDAAVAVLRALDTAGIVFVRRGDLGPTRTPQPGDWADELEHERADELERD